MSSFTHRYGDKCFCGRNCTDGPFKCPTCTKQFGKGHFVKGLPQVDKSLYGTGCRRHGFDPAKHNRSDYTVQIPDPPASSTLEKSTAWSQGRDDALVCGQFRARTIPGAMWWDARASTCVRNRGGGWWLFTCRAGARRSSGGLVGVGDWVKRHGGCAAMWWHQKVWPVGTTQSYTTSIRIVSGTS